VTKRKVAVTYMHRIPFEEAMGNRQWAMGGLGLSPSRKACEARSKVSVSPYCLLPTAS
jgi:hypothetical protein